MREITRAEILVYICSLTGLTATGVTAVVKLADDAGQGRRTVLTEYVYRPVWNRTHGYELFSEQPFYTELEKNRTRTMREKLP